MKPSQIAYSTLDKIYTAANSNDRANRGVTWKAGAIALLFSSIVWAGLYFLFQLISK